MDPLMPQRALFASLRNSLAVLAIFALAGLTLAGPAAAETLAPDGCYPIPEVKPPPSVSQPFNIDLIKQQLLYYRCAHYDREVAAVYSEAQRWVQMRAPQVSQGSKPAIVLDIDESSLSNWTRIKRDDFAYIRDGACDLSKQHEPCGDIAWQKSGLAPALAPALELFNFAKCSIQPPGTTCTRVAVFFVTGRAQSAEAQKWTETNLTNAKYRDWDGLYMRDPAIQGQS